jgi:hypothetical protein
MKTIIQVWTQHVKDVSIDKEVSITYWGFGDLLRGTIKLYQLSKKLSFNFIVDIQLHPICKILKYEKHEYSDFILEHKDEVIFIDNLKLDNYLKTSFLENKELLYFMTNDCINLEPFDEDCKNFLKTFLTPTQEFMEFYREKSKIIPFTNYNILHYRVGDNVELVNENNKSGFHHLMRSVKQNIEKDDILFSDSKKFKKYVDIYFKIFFFKLDIGHTGFDNNEEKLKNTMFEFFVLTKAKKIKTFSVYGWTSGFVSWACQIYDIPLKKITI